MIFGLGITISGYLNPKVVINAFNMNDNNWNPYFFVAYLTTIIEAIILFKIIMKRSKPYYAFKFSVPPESRIDLKLLIGSAIFGVGYGLTGFCVASTIINAFFSYSILIWMVCMSFGMICAQGVLNLILGEENKPLIR